MMGISTQAELLGHWNFENIKNGVLPDLSGKGNHGVIHGNPEIVDGISGKALRFSTNDDYVDFGKPIIPEDDFTVSAWINCDSVEKQFFLGQYKYEAAGRLDLAIREGRARIQIEQIIDSPKLIEPRKWNHIVFTRKAGILRIYLNSNMVMEKEHHTRVIRSASLILGKLFVPKRNDFRLCGMIDELKIWDSGISESEIKNEFKAQAQD